MYETCDRLDANLSSDPSTSLLLKLKEKPLAYTYEANAADFIEQFTKMFTNKEEMIVLIGGDTINERTNLEIDNPELNGLAAYLAENIGYENIAVVPGRLRWMGPRIHSGW